MENSKWKITEKAFILCFSTNWKVFFVFWIQAKKEKASWFHPRPSAKIRV